MQVWHGLGQVPSDVTTSVVTIGNFDGVHRGHRGVLAHVVARARENGALAVAMTFDPHPARVHRPQDAPEELTGLEDKLALLAETGLDAVLVVHYTADFAGQDPEHFVRRYLVDALHPVVVVIGRDVRFGAGNTGDRGTMAALGGALGFDVDVVEDVVPDASERRWSSTWARELLAAGDVAGLALVLGRLHRMRGAVVHGEARGRALGFPTANLDPAASGAVPADGVYAGWLLRDGGRGDRLPAAISVGTNPTFDGLVRQVEAHVLGRTDLDLYGEEVVVEFAVRLRPTLRFDGVDPLVEQMREDVADAARALGVPAPAPLATVDVDPGTPHPS
ncbi:riboflavin biosynthesis protein RibF [Beutenbergia cavernae DSM 12333]|uniref:Riboflavin biosynthesis protein n=1 Tax=Beutenbergia cavernae (strain ATCC BAA-8 / DSM 12333 / CCUG 43141 / JCM 11478 / NBRC 16432 / NCIMB 13614 / HKI 0122) TaxID=471853 RepID=C5BWS0_BEUC1|nr:bifunctional riboflavin kinase/FAD synthetase [Beutenbergia cavernae]ACQ80736.1 riboflavin biosynthesis protein RibF [Beutenbergia cavernae DSM 12333]